MLALAERNLTLAEASLRSGQADVTVLLEAQREVTDARARLNDLEQAAALARIELEYAVGGVLAWPPTPGPDPLDRGPSTIGAGTPPKGLDEVPSGARQ